MLLEQIKSLFKKAKDSLAVLMIILLLTKVLGFLKFRIFSSLGLSREMDIFWAAFTIPDTIFNVLVGGSINAAIIPVLTSVLHKKGERELKDTFKRITIVYSLCFVILSIVLFIFSPVIAEFMVKSPVAGTVVGINTHIGATDVDLFSNLMRIMLLSPILLGLSSFLTAYLQIKKKFFVTALAPLFYNIVTIIAAPLFIRNGGGVSSIAWVIVASAFAHLVVQIPSFMQEYKASNLKIDHIFKGIYSSIFNSEIVTVFKLAVPRIIGLFGEQVNVFINTVIGLTLSAGSLGAFEFASNLYFFPIQIFVGAITQIALPSLAEAYAKDDKEGFAKIFDAAVQQMLYILLPITAFFIVLRLPIVRLTYGVGAFDWWATIVTSWCLVLLSLSIVTQAIVSITWRAFYAIHETKLPIIATIVTIIVNVIGSIYLTNFFSHYLDWRPIISQIFVQLNGHNIPEMGSVMWSFIEDTGRWMTTRNVSPASVGGLALSTSISFFVEMVVALFLLNTKIQIIRYETIIGPAIKKIFNTLIMGISMYFVYRVTDRLVDTQHTVNVIIVVLITVLYGSLIYVIGSYVMKIKEINSIMAKVKDFSAQVFNIFKLAFNIKSGKE